jgi:hypothetical protein
MDRSVLDTKPLVELKSIAADLHLRGYQRLRKADLIDRIVAAANGAGGSTSQTDPATRAAPAQQLDLAGTAADAGEPPAGHPAGTNGDRRVMRTRTSAADLPAGAGQGTVVSEPPAEADTPAAPADRASDAERRAESEQTRTRVRTRNRERGSADGAAAEPSPSGADARPGERGNGRDVASQAQLPSVEAGTADAEAAPSRDR